jgi:hypothetical protein
VQDEEARKSIADKESKASVVYGGGGDRGGSSRPVDRCRARPLFLPLLCVVVCSIILCAATALLCVLCVIVCVSMLSPHCVVWCGYRTWVAFQTLTPI